MKNMISDYSTRLKCLFYLSTKVILLFFSNALFSQTTLNDNFTTLNANSGPQLSYPSPIFVQTGFAITPIVPQNTGSAIALGNYTTVSPFIGSGTQGNTNNTDPLLAQLNAPMGMVQVGNDIYFSDQYNDCIKRYNATTGAITTFAGGTVGSIDGTGTSARFNNPAGLDYDDIGNLYVADWGNNNIRKIVLSSGVVTTIAGGSSSLWGHINASGTAARFAFPTDVKFRIESGISYLYVADARNNAIRRINLANNSVETFAGNSTSGTTEGTLANARFNVPVSMVFSQTGVLYIVDRGNNKIRKIENGTVSTYAGSGTDNTTNGTGTAAAFSDPWGIEIDGANNLYVSQAKSGGYPSTNPGFSILGSSNNFIRKIDANGVVSNFIGTGNQGTDNAIGSLATLSLPTCLLIDADKKIMYVSEWLGDKIRKVAMTGYTISAAMPAGLIFDVTNGTISGIPASNAVIERTVCGYNYNGTNCTQFTINAVSLPTITTTVISTITATAAFTGGSISTTGGSLLSERGICWSTTAVPTVSSNKIVDPATTSGTFTSTISGLTASTTYYVRAYAITNIGVAYGQEISFTTTIPAPNISYPSSVTVQANNPMTAVQVTNTGGLVFVGNSVTTVAGSTLGFEDGTGAVAKFSSPRGVAADSNGNIFVADAHNHRIRKITPEGVVTTFAGSTVGFVDGNGADAKFNFPHGLTIDAAGNLFVADFFNHKIRKITPAGVVTTVAGNTSGFADGTGTNVRFDGPSDVKIDGSGNLFVADYFNHKIRKMTPQGVVTTFAGSTVGFQEGFALDAKFNYPMYLALDNNGNVFVADILNYKIRKITQDGNVTTLAGSTQGVQDGLGSSASFWSPCGLDVDISENVYVADAGRIRKITPSGNVTTYAGSSVQSDTDGTLITGRFRNISDLVLDHNGHMFVVDITSHRVRKIIENTYYSISPSLPTGLIFSANGSISGTPMQLSPVTSYTITAMNAGGSSTAVIALEVKDLNVWKGSASALWSNPSNWSKNQIPTSTDDVHISTTFLGAVVPTSRSPILDIDFTLGVGKTLNLFSRMIVNPTKTFTIEGTANINDSELRFNSDGNGSGMLGRVSGSLTGCNYCRVFRYIPAKRAFRFLSPSVTTVSPIGSNWQSETHITGQGGVSNGFDTTSTNNPSLFTYDNISQNWVPVTTLINTFLTPGRGYRIMIRGNRSINLASNSPTATETILSDIGSIFQGDFNATDLSSVANNFNFIGNPHQAIIDMEAVLNQSTNIDKQYYYIWDPTINSRGAYVAVGVLNGLTNNPTSVATKYLQPNQAFFVKNSASMTGIPTLRISENHKSTVASNPNLFRTAITSISNSVLKLTLQNDAAEVLDGVSILFDEEASNDVDQNDAGRLGNLDEEVAIFKSNKYLTIEERNFPLPTDVIHLNTKNYRGINYKFKATLQNYEGLTPYLWDSFTQIFTELIPNQEVAYSFSINEISNHSNRFKVVFQNSVLHTGDFAKNIKVYPNPTKAGASFYVDGITEAEVTVYNLVGQNIPVKVLSQGKSIQVTPTVTLNQGIYLVTIITEGKIAQVKWIVE